MLGLGLFAYFGDPAGGNENAPGGEWAIAIAVIVLASAACCCGGRGGLSTKAAVYGTVAGILSASRRR